VVAQKRGQYRNQAGADEDLWEAPWIGTAGRIKLYPGGAIW